MTESRSRRVIAIVGRPNVGKSALFNRLVGRRISIVHEASGVTRDRVGAEAHWGGTRFELVDTGGLGLMDGAKTEDRFDAGIRQQVKAAIEDAAVLIFVVDITAGVVPLDQEVARLLHSSGCFVLLAANKADTPVRDEHVAEFAALGFPAYAVSALHGRGLDDLMSAALGQLPDAGDDLAAERLKVAVVGKPNAGKSSYINRLLRSDRVMVSEIPGTTRDSVEIPFSVGQGDQARHYLLVDTAGIRRNRRIHDAVELFSGMRTERAVEQADVVVHLVDAVEGFGVNDKKIAGLIARAQKGSLLLINKWDLMDEVTQRAFGQALLKIAPFLRNIPVQFTSAETGYNIRRTVEAIDYVATQVRATLPTGTLNRVLHDSFTRTPPPVFGRQRTRFFYATQTGTQPVRVRLFVSNPKTFTSAYQAYLERRLREAFGLEGAPLVLKFAARRPARKPRG